jgi:hypothetical protein
MTSPKLALLGALLCAGVRASAQTQTTPTLASPGWTPAYRQQVKTIFDKLLKTSGYDLPDALRKDGRDKTELIYWEKDRLMEGSPLVALAAKTGPNPKNNAIVIVTYGALEICDEDHLAFMTAHEIAHLVHGHPQKLVKIQKEIFDRWYADNTARVNAMDPKDAVAAFAKEKETELGDRNKPFEREADTDGLVLMANAGYDAGKGADALNRANDWLAVLKMDRPDTAHDPLAVRAAELQKEAAQMQKGNARMQEARGRTANVMSSAPN